MDKKNIKILKILFYDWDVEKGKNCYTKFKN